MKLYMFRAVPLPETCRLSCRSKFGKLVHLVGFIIKKFVTMHGHMNVKFLKTEGGASERQRAALWQHASLPCIFRVL